ncbi:hypothetical protein AsAng_0015890 [Aureispira anguillae]|uniref:Uncharacterized protein n=1 Tax=Aureispira anguillae TaxID=2864201 RepID=A0A915YD53_9BACT|nr:hypothetical protein AsAng_0015890 [Aureispira anguillae]
MGQIELGTKSISFFMKKNKKTIQIRTYLGCF